MSAIVHIVMWQLNGTSSAIKEEQSSQVVQAFEQIRGVISGLLQMEVGRNINQNDQTWDVALYMAFDSDESLALYQAHPAHLAIKSLVGPLCLARCQVDFPAYEKALV